MFLKISLSFLLAIIVTHFFASIVATQFVLAELVDMGVQVSLQTRIETSLSDMVSAAPLFLALVVPSLLCALLLRMLLCRLWRSDLLPKTKLFTLVILNGVLLVAGNTLINHLVGISLVAGFRDFGIIGLAFAGFIGAASYVLSMGQLKGASNG